MENLLKKPKMELRPQVLKEKAQAKVLVKRVVQKEQREIRVATESVEIIINYRLLRQPLICRRIRKNVPAVVWIFNI